MRIYPKHIFLLLSIMFMVYSFSIYLTPFFILSDKNLNLNEAKSGLLVWQRYNCQACHQLYGLGGYLGPDLTNIYSKKGKGEAYIKAIISSGTKQMPSFNLRADEKKQLLDFLKMANASGIADPRNFNTQMNGMIQNK